MTATGATEDRVTVDDIAERERAGVTVTAVRYWISNGRDPRRLSLAEGRPSITRAARR